MGGRSEGDDFLLSLSLACANENMYCIFFVKSTPKTSDNKATNGDRHAMLKVIQHGVMIAKFCSDHSRRLQINQKIATMHGVG